VEVPTVIQAEGQVGRDVAAQHHLIHFKSGYIQLNRSLLSSVISVTTAESGLDKTARTH